MHNRNLPLKASMLLGIAMIAFPASVQAQSIASDWSPLEDSDAAGPAAAAEEAPRAAAVDRPRVEITPYLEVQQVLFADLDGGRDVLTYSTVAAGVDAAIATRRAAAQVSVRYERIIGYDDQVADQDILTGLARGSVALTRNLSIETGAIASRSQIDSRGPSQTANLPFSDNVTQVYSVYVGPSFSTQVGNIGIGASYRAGYTKVEGGQVNGLPTGQAPIDVFNDSTSHAVSVSVAQKPGSLPFGWAVSGGYNREDASQLDMRFEDVYARGDVTVPLSPTLALVGGVGYEKVRISERDAVRDALGNPVIGSGGRLVTDPNSPRLDAYETEGLIWDAGVLWRPSRRTSLEARYGRRYGSDTYYGTFSYAPNDTMGVGVSVYDYVAGFGGSLNRALSGLPTQFNAVRNPLTGDLSGCAFAVAGGACLNNALRSPSSAAFRARGVQASLSTSAGGWQSGLAIGYDHRKFLVSNVGGQAQISGLSDENYYLSGYLGRELDRRSSISTNVYANLNDPGQAGAPDSYGFGANVGYYRNIWRGLSASAAVGIDTFEVEDVSQDVTASALLGLRYSF